MDYIEKVKGKSIKHKLGNIISGFADLADGLVSILSLGNLNGNISTMWLFYQRRNNFLTDYGRKDS